MKHQYLYSELKDPKLDSLIEDWKWLIKEQVSFVTITAMGDLILKQDNGSYHFLDTIEGKYFQIADDLNEYEGLIKKSDYRQRLLQYYTVLYLREENITLETNQCYSPDIPPHLGGKLDENNLKPTDIYVHFSMSGQIWEQTKDLKEGTKIGNVTISSEKKKGFFARLFG